MLKACSTLVLGTGVCIIAMTSCVDSAESPSDHPAPPRHVPEFRPAGSTLQPVDLVYICGNKFLATNGTLHAVQVSYRVVGTDETATLTLRPGVDEDPGNSETELATRERGAVELYRNDQLVVRRRNEGRSCGAPAMSAAALSGGAGGGSWTAPFPWPIVALQVTLLPNGKVLGWGHTGDPQVWDPTTGSFTQAPEPIELF